MNNYYLKKLLLISIACALVLPISSIFAHTSHKHTSYKHSSYTNTFVFNPRTRSWVAYGSSGQVIASGKGSGGSNYCRDIHRSCHTPVGTFHVIGTGGAGCKSSRYPVGHPGAPMPYCAYFTKNYAVHGSYEVKSYNASHGCIRIQPSAAKWLMYHFFHIGTKVVVLPY